MHKILELDLCHFPMECFCMVHPVNLGQLLASPHWFYYCFYSLCHHICCLGASTNVTATKNIVVVIVVQEANYRFLFVAFCLSKK